MNRELNEIGTAAFTPPTSVLNMSGSPPSRERIVTIYTVVPLKIARYEQYEAIWLHLPPPERDLMEHLGQLALQAGYKNLGAALNSIRIPDGRLMAILEQPKEPDWPPATPERQLRNALLLAKTATLTYDPEIPPVFTRRRLQRHMTLIHIRLENYYELD
ncbi:MAG: hypothetical protein ACKO3B_08130 [Bacteroidota bacterium]